MKILAIYSISINQKIVVDKVQKSFLTGIFEFFQKAEFISPEIEDFIRSDSLAVAIKYNKCHPAHHKTHYYYAEYNKEINKGLLIITDQDSKLIARLMPILKEIQLSAKDITHFNDEAGKIKADPIQYLRSLNEDQEPKQSWFSNPFRKK